MEIKCVPSNKVYREKREAHCLKEIDFALVISTTQRQLTAWNVSRYKSNNQ